MRAMIRSFAISIPGVDEPVVDADGIQELLVRFGRIGR
jgi:hypothetical protein